MNATVVAMTEAETISDEDVTQLHSEDCPDFQYVVERQNHDSYAVCGRGFHVAFSFLMFKLI